MIDTHEALCRYPLFGLLPTKWLKLWMASGEVMPTEPGQTIFSINSPGTHVFLILSGKVRVSRPDTGDREFALGLLKPGQVFGEYALLPPGVNTATCRAGERGHLLRLPLPPLRDEITSLLGSRTRLKDWLRLNYVAAAFRGHSALGFMAGSSFLPMMSRYEKARFASGETIQADGLQFDRLFQIESGEARLEEDGESTRVLRVGDCFGARGLVGLSGLPVVTAMSDVACEMLKREDFDPPSDVARSESFQTAIPSGVIGAPCYEWVAQQSENDCGVASLAMAARVLGRRVSLAELRRQIQVLQVGTSLQELQRAAGQLGFRTQAVRIGLDHLSAVRFPAIAHLTTGHYVVLFELNPGGVMVGDPATGVGSWPLATLQRTWSGQLLLLAS